MERFIESFDNAIISIMSPITTWPVRLRRVVVITFPFSFPLILAVRVLTLVAVAIFNVFLYFRYVWNGDQ